MHTAEKRTEAGNESGDETFSEFDYCKSPSNKRIKQLPWKLSFVKGLLQGDKME